MLGKCVVCGRTTSGKFGDTEICVCWNDYENGNLLTWAEEHGKQGIVSKSDDVFKDGYSGKAFKKKK